MRKARREVLGELGYARENERVYGGSFLLGNDTMRSFNEICPNMDITSLEHVAPG